jgi:hypothetical protein
MSHDRATFDTFTYIGPDPLLILHHRRLAIGGAFKTEEVTSRSGKVYSRLAVGSGGAMCVARSGHPLPWLAAKREWASTTPCTPMCYTGADPRQAAPPPVTHIRALRPLR